MQSPKISYRVQSPKIPPRPYLHHSEPSLSSASSSTYRGRLRRLPSSNVHPWVGALTQELPRVEAKIPQLLTDLNNGLIARRRIERPEVLLQHARAPVILRLVELGLVTTVPIAPPAR